MNLYIKIKFKKKQELLCYGQKNRKRWGVSYL